MCYSTDVHHEATYIDCKVVQNFTQMTMSKINSYSPKLTLSAAYHTEKHLFHLLMSN